MKGLSDEAMKVLSVRACREHFANFAFSLRSLRLKKVMKKLSDEVMKVLLVRVYRELFAVKKVMKELSDEDEGFVSSSCDTERSRSARIMHTNVTFSLTECVK